LDAAAARPTQRKPGGLFGSLPKLPRLQAPRFPHPEAGARKGAPLFGGLARRGGAKAASVEGGGAPQVEVIGWEEAAALDLAPGDADGGVWAL
jgi:hypothetical protein